MNNEQALQIFKTGGYLKDTSSSLQETRRLLYACAKSFNIRIYIQFGAVIMNTLKIKC